MALGIDFARDQRVVRIAFRVLVDRDVRTDALGLDRLARRRVVVRDRQLDAGVVRQRPHGLHRALAERGLAHDHRALVVLQRAGDDLRGRRRIGVGQHHHRDLLEQRRQILQRIVLDRRQPVIVEVGLVDPLGVGHLAIGRDHGHVLGQEGRRHADRALQHAAAVVAQVQHQALHVRILLRQLGQAPAQIGHGALLEAGQADPADGRIDHLGLDRLHADLGARDRHREGAFFALAVDRQRDLGAGLAAHALDRLFERQPAHRLVVDAGDQVAGLDAGAEGGRVLDRVDDLDQSLFLRDLDAQAGKTAARAFLQFLEILGVQIRRMRVEAGHHALDGFGQQLLVVDRLDVLALDLPEYVRHQPQLLQGQRPRGVLRGRGQLQRGEHAGNESRGDKADVLERLTHVGCLNVEWRRAGRRGLRRLRRGARGAAGPV